MTPDKTRAFQFSYDDATNQTYVTMEHDSGDPLGDPIELQGNGQLPTGNREWSLPQCNSPTTASTLIRTYDEGVNTTYVTVIDIETGEVVGGEPIELAGDGQYFNNGKFQFDGDRAYQQSSDSINNKVNLAIINTETGELNLQVVRLSHSTARCRVKCSRSTTKVA